MRDLQNEAEIAHAAVLPPPADTYESGESRIAFFTRQGTGICSSPTDMYVTAWIWDEDLRGNVTPVVDPTTPGDGSADPFCSGHTFLPNGNLLVVGGQDYTEKCPPILQSTGHAGIRVLDTSFDPPVWIPSTGLPDLVRRRWYPTAITLDDGDAFIAGHANAPIASPPSAEVYERYDWDMPGSAPTDYQNFLPTMMDPCLNNLAGPSRELPEASSPEFR